MAGSDQTYVGGFLRTVGFEVKGAAVELNLKHKLKNKAR